MPRIGLRREPLIISASRRTDIPAFFPEWFVRRVEQGEVLVRHPMNRRRVYRIPLTRESVDCIVFWTKDPRPMLPFLERLDTLGFPYYFLFTLTPYGGAVERNLPAKERLPDCFAELSERIGAQRVVWRYDPILITPQYTEAFHEERFAALAEALEGYTAACIVSFFEAYAKLRRSMERFDYVLPGEAEERALLKRLAAMAQRRGMRLSTCARDFGLGEWGVRRGKCIDDELIERISGRRVSARKDSSQRRGCGCVESRDIGSYNSCLHGCVYCYASGDQNAARRWYAGFDPDAPLLGPPLSGDETLYCPGERHPAARGAVRGAGQDAGQPFLPGFE
jgi:hypothetical protein